MSNIPDTSVAVAGAETSPSVMKKVAFASFVGTTIEFYDFFVYATAAALVFPIVFFPDMPPALAVASSFATFAVAYVARPFGAAIFGHYGDKLGRKKTLVATLLIMGTSTVLIGLLPGAATIGIAAPIILLFLRVMQGVAVGGEWAGSALLAAEYAPPKKRGLYGMFTQLGPGAALVITNVVFLVVNLYVGETSDAFMTWGWRVPFLFSAVLLIVALYVRLTIEETPVFRAEKAKPATVQKAPFLELFKNQPARVFLGAGVMLASYNFIFVGGTYLLNYGNTILEFNRTTVLIGGIVCGVAYMATTALSAWLCDRVGRKRMMVIGHAIGIPWALVVMPLVGTGSVAAFMLAIFGTMAIMGLFYGPMASFLPEIFATRYRYTGASFSYNLSGIIGGALPPVFIGALVLATGPWAIGIVMAVLAAISIVSILALPETRESSLEEIR